MVFGRVGRELGNNWLDFDGYPDHDRKPDPGFLSEEGRDHEIWSTFSKMEPKKFSKLWK